MSSVRSIHRDMADAWNRRDFAALDRLWHSEYSYMGGDGKELAGGPGVAAAVYRMFAEAFPDGTLEVRRVHADGSTAVAEMIGRGTHQGPFMGVAPTGRPVEVVICNVIELRDGKIYREREYMDMATILGQMGVSALPGQAKTA